MNIKEQYQLLSQQLQKLYSKGEADSIASWVLEHYTGLSSTAVKLYGEKQLSIHEKHLVSKALHELLQHKPVQYLLGEAWFKNMAFFVDETVLIPRPETEELVDWVANECKRNLIDEQLLEIGTGSGCIAIALKNAMPQTTVTAIDISEATLQVAKRNAKKLKTAINFLQFDFLSETDWDTLPAYKVIVSNPPYIPVSEKNKLDKNVTEWEPGTALFVPDNDPLVFYRKMAAFGKTHLKKAGIIYAECHQDYAKAVQQLFEQEGYATTLRRDLFDNERMIKGQLID